MKEGTLFRKTRLAPTPSGYLHLGNILSFAITTVIAEKTRAGTLLRIDDMDWVRSNDLVVQDIFDTLHFLSIPWNEGPKDFTQFREEYSQINRLELYRKAVSQLQEQGSLFACACSRAQVRAVNADGAYPGTCRDKNIPFDAPDVCWRLRTDGAKEIAVKTLDGTVVRSTLPPIMKDFIIKKKDGFPGYQLTSLLDDIHFGVDLIIRGADLWPSTLAQLYLSSFVTANSFHRTTFYHHQLINDENGDKLSKSGGATSIQYLRKEHRTPAEIFTMIAWELGHDATVGSAAELVELLDIKIA